MSEGRYAPLSIRGPVILFAVVLALIVTLTVLWNVVLARDYQRLKELAVQSGTFHWTFIALGSALFLTIIVLSSVLGAQLFGQIRWRQRQSDFIASVSHELNSPLSAIKLFAQTLRRPEVSDTDRRSFVEKILFDCERLSRLIANILRTAEVDSRGTELRVIPQEVELCDYLEQVLADVKALKDESLEELSFEGRPPVRVQLDRLMFRQVLDNLVDNAIRYRGDRPARIEMTLARTDGQAELRLSDRGIGIPPGEQTKVFDRFYRIGDDDPKRRRQGTGIGLFVVRSIVDAHGGRVSISSRRDGGTTVEILLPLVATEPDG